LSHGKRKTATAPLIQPYIYEQPPPPFLQNFNKECNSAYLRPEEMDVMRKRDNSSASPTAYTETILILHNTFRIHSNLKI
jgi:hypothetical protein